MRLQPSFSATTLELRDRRGVAHAFPVINKIDAVVQAKRSAPARVGPVTVNGVRYAVPHFRSESPGMAHSGGYIEAVDEKSGGRLWLKEIYRYAVHGTLEGDVQDVFIVSLEVEGASLKIRDEAGGKYQVPLPPLVLRESPAGSFVRRFLDAQLAPPKEQT